MSCTKARNSAELIAWSSHEAAQRRAIALIIIFLQRPRRYPVKAEQVGQKQRDALVDLRPEIAIGGIERIVEIEDPGVDMREAWLRARRFVVG